MRALLDLMRENEAAVQENLAGFSELLTEASKHLNILDPQLGGKELIKSVAAEMAKMAAGIAENRVPGGA